VNSLRPTEVYALTAKKQCKNAGKPLDLQRKEKYYGRAIFWSPSKFKRAREREVERQHQEEQERLAKLNKKELQAAAKLPREQKKEERRVARERAKEVRDQMKAKQVAAQEARKAAQTLGRPLQSPKEASAKLLKHIWQYMSQNKPNVVLQLVWRPQKLHQHLHQRSTPAAAQSKNQLDIHSTD
jgi:hypothetical protein